MIDEYMPIAKLSFSPHRSSKLDEVNLIIFSADLIQLDLILILRKRCVADPAGDLF